SLQDDRSKDYIPPPNNNMMPNRPSILHDSSPMNSEHGIHPGYPPLQPNNPGYIHPESRRVSDSTINSQQSSLTRGYPPHGPPVAESQPPHTSHRPIGSHHNSPSLLPTHIQPQNHPIRHNQSMPNIHPDSQHRTPPSPLSRSGSVPRQQPTTLPPIQSQSSYISQPLPAQGPPSHLYNGKSSPVPPPLIPPQSPAMNHYHSSQQGLVSQQNGSRLPPVGSHHHNSQPPELVGPSNNDQHQIISRPLTSFLRDQPAGYGSAHPHNIQPNGLGPVGPQSHVGPPLSSGPRNGPNGYY
ncbi:10160_t:CDS:2, partial [Cetraspora pellucida]